MHSALAFPASSAHQLTSAVPKYLSRLPVLHFITAFLEIFMVSNWRVLRWYKCNFYPELSTEIRFHYKKLMHYLDLHVTQDLTIYHAWVQHWLDIFSQLCNSHFPSAVLNATVDRLMLSGNRDIVLALWIIVKSYSSHWCGVSHL